MRISDWSSDLCSSDLVLAVDRHLHIGRVPVLLVLVTQLAIRAPYFQYIDIVGHGAPERFIGYVPACRNRRRINPPLILAETRRPVVPKIPFEQVAVIIIVVYAPEIALRRPMLIGPAHVRRHRFSVGIRSEGRSVGKECVSKCR